MNINIIGKDVKVLTSNTSKLVKIEDIDNEFLLKELKKIFDNEEFILKNYNKILFMIENFFKKINKNDLIVFLETNLSEDIKNIISSS